MFFFYRGIMVSELQTAIEDQAADDASRHIKPEKDFVPWDTNKIPPELLATPNLSKHISWGRPAQILEAKHDKRCPVCGRIRGLGFVRKDGSVQRGHFDIGFDESGCYGARCRTMACNGLQHYRVGRYTNYRCNQCGTRRRCRQLLVKCSCAGEYERMDPRPDVAVSDFSF